MNEIVTGYSLGTAASVFKSLFVYCTDIQSIFQ